MEHNKLRHDTVKHIGDALCAYRENPYSGQTKQKADEAIECYKAYLGWSETPDTIEMLLPLFD